MNNPLELDFWVRPADQIDHDLAQIRDAGPQFFPLPASDIAALGDQGSGAWSLTSHSDILLASKSAPAFSSAAGITMLDAPPEFNEFFSSLIGMDDPRHARLRKLVSAGFTPRMLQRLQVRIVELADSIIDDVAEKGECDFVEEIAAPMPLKIVCDLMGVPRSQYRFVFDQTNVILGSADPEYVGDVADIDEVLTAILAAGGELAGLMNEVAEHKRGKDGDDLTSILVNAEVDGERLTYAEVASFFILLVVAGNETTRNAISWGLRYLTDNPEQRALWQQDPEGLAASAVEEIVRLASPVTYMRRTMLEDQELSGVTLGEGQKVLLFYLAANRDPAVFDDPLRFDVLRDPNPHVGFGGPGPHFCLGAHLARREIAVMFQRLFERLPDIHASGEPDLLRASFIHGIKHLPASFTPVSLSTKP